VPGVVAVFTFETLARWLRPLPRFGGVPPLLEEQVRFAVKEAAQYPLASDVVRTLARAWRW